MEQTAEQIVAAIPEDKRAEVLALLSGGGAHTQGGPKGPPPGNPDPDA